MTKKIMKRNGLSEQVRRIVIKVGSRVLVDEGGRPDLENIESLVAEIARLHSQGCEVLLVSSGAIAAGVQTLGWAKRPTNLSDLQMAAAVGQSVLMNRYTLAFSAHSCTIGQVLLTHNDLNDRERHLNARNTILSMLRNRVVPVVNENDVVAVDEIRFGDNDVLASMVSTLVDSDLLILLTTSDGLFKVEDGEMKERIPILKSITEDVLAMAQGKGSTWSSGGMASKLEAARSAVQSGTEVVIADGRVPGVLRKILDGEDVGTLIQVESRMKPMRARKKWIAFFHRPQGSIVVDEGAKRAICLRGNSLLPVGIDQVIGRFKVGALVNIKSQDGETVARGISAYSFEDIERIKGLRSSDILPILGERFYEEVIHRDNMVVLKKETTEK